MPKTSSIQCLSTSTQDELIQRLRSSNYGTIDEHLGWLHGKGHTVVTRSALGRFIKRLASVDALNGVTEAQMRLAAKAKGGVTAPFANRLAKIAERIASITAEYAILSAQLTEISRAQSKGASKKIVAQK